MVLCEQVTSEPEERYSSIDPRQINDDTNGLPDFALPVSIFNVLIWQFKFINGIYIDKYNNKKKFIGFMCPGNSIVHASQD